MDLKKCIPLMMSLSAWSTPIVSMAAVPSSSFSGFYLGGDVGVAWGTSHYQTNPGCRSLDENAVFCNVNPDPSITNGTAVATSGTGKMTLSGVTGGVQAGHNWQREHVFFGGEGDFGALNLNKSVRPNGTFPFTFLGTQYSLTESISTNWLATLRGRIGTTVIHPQFLLYGTAGAAFTNYKISSGYSDNAIGGGFPGGTGYGNHSNNISGWTVGGGGEWLLMEHFSIKVEYLYVDFGSVTVSVPTSNTPSYTQTIQVKTALTANLIRFGLNYRFA